MTELCIATECPSPAGKTRGLCDACYKAALRLIRKGRTCWPELVSHGLARPARDFAPNTNPLTVALKRLRSIPISSQPGCAGGIRPDNASARVWSALVTSLSRGAA